ncbi:MAG: biopolymer transporter ExbD [Candidatus Zixiibacteriota bacterium]
MRRPHRRTYHAMADINIANLVDVCLVLLIIFMISAPLLQSGIDVNLPKVSARPANQEHEGIVVSIDKSKGVYINDHWAKIDDFENLLDKEMRAKGTKSVFLRSDSAVPYGLAIEVIGRMKAAGIEDIGLVTTFEPLKKKSARK